MSAAGRPHAEVVQDEEPIDLAALPDPRPMVAVTSTATRRLLDDLETASRRFQTSRATVAAEVIEFEQLVATNQLDRRSLPSRAGSVVDVLDLLTRALAEAELQHDRNIAVLVTFERAVAQLDQSTHPPDVRAAVGYRDRTADLIVADGDLRAAMKRALPMLPSFVAATARVVQAAGIVSRRLLVADVTRQINNARLILNVALSHKQMQAEHEAGLLKLVDRMAQRTGQALPLPEVIWPAGGKGSDPFAAPTLKD